MLVERTVPWHLIEGRQGYCRSSCRTRPALDLLDKCFPDPVSLVAGVDAAVEDVGGVVKDTYEYVAHYLVVNHSYPGAF